MSFRSIGDLAISVLAKLDIEATEEGCAVEAHSLRPATGKSGDQLSSREGTAKPVAYALANRGKPPRNGNGKKTGTEAPASADREDNVKQEKKSAVNLRVVSDNRRCMPRQSRTVPRRGLGIHLRLVASH